MNTENQKMKRTEIGWIPSDWQVKTIGDIFSFYSTSNFSKAEMSLEGSGYIPTYVLIEISKLIYIFFIREYFIDCFHYNKFI